MSGFHWCQNSANQSEQLLRKQFHSCWRLSFFGEIVGLKIKQLKNNNKKTPYDFHNIVAPHNFMSIHNIHVLLHIFRFRLY